MEWKLTTGPSQGSFLMPGNKTTFTYELDAAQQDKLLALVSLGNYKPRKVPYSLMAMEGDGFNCTLYEKEKHGRRKCCIQGLLPGKPTRRGLYINNEEKTWIR